MKTIKTDPVKVGILQNPSEGTMVVPLEMKDGKIVRVSGYDTCRESIISYISNFLTPKKIYVRPDLKAQQKKDFEWFTSKARVIFIGRNTTCVKAVEEGGALNVLHMLEEKLDMPKTECFIVNTGPHAAKIRLMFQGHNRWLRSAHTFSLWAMLIRMGLRDEKFRVSDWSKLEKLVSRYPNKIGNQGHATHGRDKFYTKKTMNNWIRLMENLDKVFPVQVPWFKRWSPEHVLRKKGKPYTPGMGGEGIYKLINKDSIHRNAKKFYDLMAESKGK